MPTVAMAQQWHRDAYQGVALPVRYYAGEVRDDDPDFPELRGYEVAAGSYPGTPSALVHRALASFEQGMQSAVGQLDLAVPTGQPPVDASQLTAIVELAATAHGEWIRIHPFASGNGRTARLWVAWVAARYTLPLFLSVKPRPAALQHAIAANYSMTGNHAAMALFLADELASAIGT